MTLNFFVRNVDSTFVSMEVSTDISKLVTVSLCQPKCFSAYKMVCICVSWDALEKDLKER